MLYDGEKEVFYLFGGGVIFRNVIFVHGLLQGKFLYFERSQKRWSVMGLVEFSLCECGQ